MIRAARSLPLSTRAASLTGRLPAVARTPSRFYSSDNSNSDNNDRRRPNHWSRDRSDGDKKPSNITRKPNTRDETMFSSYIPVSTPRDYEDKPITHPSFWQRSANPNISRPSSSDFNIVRPSSGSNIVRPSSPPSSGSHPNIIRTAGPPPIADPSDRPKFSRGEAITFSEYKPGDPSPTGVFKPAASAATYTPSTSSPAYINRPYTRHPGKSAPKESWLGRGSQKSKLAAKKPEPEEDEDKPQKRYNPADVIPPTLSIVPIRREPLPPPPDMNPLGDLEFPTTHSFRELLASDIPVQVYISASINPYHNIALENWLFANGGKDKIQLFLYRNDRSVVIGRNQNPWLETNHPLLIPDPNAPRKYPDGKPIPTPNPPPKLIRRRSGGGTVWHDVGNVNYSITVPTAQFSRSKHAEMVAEVVKGFGIYTARVNDRNDVVMDSCSTIVNEDDYTPVPEKCWPEKISGSAYKLTKDRSLHHGTMLCQSHLHSMRYLRSPLKQLACIRARGVESVSADVNNTTIPPEWFMLKTVEAFKDLYKDSASGVAVVLPNEPKLLVGFEEELQTMRSQDWLYGQTPRFWVDLPAKRGTVEVDKGVIVAPEAVKGQRFGNRALEKLMETENEEGETVEVIEGGKDWVRKCIGGLEWGIWEYMRHWLANEGKRRQRLLEEAEREENRMRNLWRRWAIRRRWAMPPEKRAEEEKKERERLAILLEDEKRRIAEAAREKVALRRKGGKGNGEDEGEDAGETGTGVVLTKREREVEREERRRIGEMMEEIEREARREGEMPEKGPEER